MAPPLTPLVIRRLAYTRFLYEEGARYAQRPALLAATAVLAFHDAVEHFLGLAADHHGTNPDPKIQFMQYWAELKKAQIDLPRQGAMRRLNDARVAMKHHGNFPAQETIESSREAVLNFLTVATPTVFGIDFDAIDMVGLVTQPEVGQLLREAQTHAGRGDYNRAMAGLSLAFQALLGQYAGGSASYGWEQSPFSFGPRLPLRWQVPVFGDSPEAQVERITAIAQETQQGMQVISLGIDFPSFARFQVLAPRVHGFFDGSHKWYTRPSETLPTAEDYGWARGFVIESSLQAARADEVLDLLKAQTEANWPPMDQPEEHIWTGPAEET